MSGSARETTIEEIAKTLVTRRERDQRPVLFLGARAGGLFGNEYLYEMLKNFSLLNFDTLSNVDKFRECYYVLNRHFTESERHNILVGALATLTYREEDKLLAELVKVGFFEAVISTNIDNLLEDACSSLGMRELDDYRVFIPGAAEIKEFEHNKPRYRSLIKVFGDLESRNYSIAGEALNLQTEYGLQEYLVSLLSREVLLVGYDPVWDHGIEAAVPANGGTVWYINETELLPGTHLASIFNQRNGRAFQNEQGNYSSFLLALYNFLGDRLSQEEIAATPLLLQPQLPDQERKKIFISYNGQDRPYLERLITHLKGYTLKDRIDIWDETKMIPGKDWKETIKQALSQAKVAVLLVSSHFLSSDFTNKDELPILLEAADRGDVELLPIIIDPSASLFNERDPLNQYQVMNSSSKPVRWMKPYEQEVMWNKLAEQVYSILLS
jgi:hypothetical protein